MRRLPGRGDEGGADLAAEAVRMGMFCRLGLVDERRPVAVPTWLKVVWIAAFGVGERGERVEIGALELGELAVLEDECGDVVVFGEVFEDVLRGGDDLALAVLHAAWAGASC